MTKYPNFAATPESGRCLQQWTDDFLAAGRRALSPDVRNTGQSNWTRRSATKSFTTIRQTFLCPVRRMGKFCSDPSRPSRLRAARNTRDHWADQEERKVFIDQLMQARRVENMFFRGRMYDGSEFPAQLSSRLIEHEGQTISITTSTDSDQSTVHDARDRAGEPQA